MKHTVIKPSRRIILRHPFSVLAAGFSLLFFSQLFGAVVIALLPNTLTESPKLFTLLLGSLAFLLSVLYVVLKITKTRWSAIGFSKPKGKWLRLILNSTALYVLLSVALMSLASLLFKNFNASEVQDVGLSGFDAPWELVFGFLALVVITPVIEEILFRGIIFKGLAKTMPLWAAIGISTVLFAVAHGQWNVALDTFALGIFLAYLTHKTGSIIPAMLLHAVKNAVAFVLLFAITN